MTASSSCSAVGGALVANCVARFATARSRRDARRRRSLVDAIADADSRRRRPGRAGRGRAALAARRARRGDRRDRRGRPHRPRGRAQRARPALRRRAARRGARRGRGQRAAAGPRSTASRRSASSSSTARPRQVLQLRSFPLRRDGEVVGAVAFTRDVSEARRVESVRRDFVANVSHELKTPIGALGLLAETMAAHRRRGGRAPARRPRRARGRPAVAHRRRPARPQPDRGAGGADPGADADAAADRRRRSTSCRPPPISPRCRSSSRPSRPTSRSSATAARCAARS